MIRPPPRSTLFPTRRSSDLPGFSRFFVSFEDDLMRNFGAAERMTKLMERFGMQEGEALEHPWLNKSVDRKSTRLNSSHSQISYAVFCLKKKKKTSKSRSTTN